MTRSGDDVVPAGDAQAGGTGGATEVASAVGSGLDEVGSLEQVTHCSRLLAARVVGLARVQPGVLDDEDLLEPAAA